MPVTAVISSRRCQASTHLAPLPLPFSLPCQAFTRSSQLEPDNGEAWNNLAAIHMHLQHWPQAFNALSGGKAGVSGKGSV